jgi:hypothetical protein
MEVFWTVGERDKEVDKGMMVFKIIFKQDFLNGNQQ